MRFAYLFLRTRQAGRAVILLIAVAAAAWLWRRLTVEDTLSVRMLLLMPPLAVAAIVGAGVGGPFRELEATGSRPLPPFRLGHLAALLLLAALGLIAARGTLDWAIMRNVAGFAGLALLTARVAGSAAAWVVPAGYAIALLWGTPSSEWMWPLQAATDHMAAAIGATLGLVGLAVVAWLGARDRLDEAM